MLLFAVPNLSFILDFAYSISNKLILYATVKCINEVISSMPDSASYTCMKTKEELPKRLLSAVGPGCFDINLNLIVTLSYTG